MLNNTISSSASSMRFKNKPQVQSSGMKISNTYVVVISLLAMAVSLISIYSVIIVLFGLLPGMIAMIVDQDPKHYISKIVLNYNGLGILPYLFKIFQSHNPNKEAIDMIIDPRTWMLIFAASGLGWLVYWIFPQAAIALQNLKLNLRTRQLEMELNRLYAEWGDEIKSMNRK